MRVRTITARFFGLASARWRASADGPFFPWFVIALTLVTLLSRANYGFGSGRYLWAEDGLTFFNRARTGGFETLTLPYEGYLHILPRLVAWGSSGLPLTLQPFVYSSAWLLAVAVMVGTIAVRGRAVGMDGVTICGVALLSTFQPASNEMFFNLTNAQWFLGVALTLQMLTRQEWPEPPWQLVGVMLLCLTGPFCIVILPLVLVAQIGRRPPARTLVVLGCFVAATAVQLLFLLTTDRTAGKTEHVALGSAVTAMARLFVFLPGRMREWIPAIGFWLVYAPLLVAAVASRASRHTMHTRVVVLLVAAAIAFLAASIITGAFPPRVLSYGLNRYTWIPYSLVIFTAAMLSINVPMARLWMAGCLALICFFKGGPLVKPDLHYASFVKLAQLGPVAIPINPVGTAAAWQFETGMPSSIHEQSPVLETRVGANAFIDLSNRKLICDSATDIAIEVVGDHLVDGQVTLSWSPSETFARSESMERWYWRGPSRMQYAFPYPVGGVYLRSGELGDPALVALRQVTVLCLR